MIPHAEKTAIFKKSNALILHPNTFGQVSSQNNGGLLEPYPSIHCATQDTGLFLRNIEMILGQFCKHKMTDAKAPDCMYIMTFKCDFPYGCPEFSAEFS